MSGKSIDERLEALAEIFGDEIKTSFDEFTLEAKRAAETADAIALLAAKQKHEQYIEAALGRHAQRMNELYREMRQG